MMLGSCFKITFIYNHTKFNQSLFFIMTLEAVIEGSEMLIMETDNPNWNYGKYSYI